MNYKRNGFNFFIIIFSLKIYESNSELNFKYPTSISLYNKNILVIEEKGIYVCDPELNTIIKEIQIFSENEKISSLNKLSTVILIKQQSFIISLINYKVYFFDTDGTFLYNNDTLIQNFNPTSVSLTPITINNGIVDYVVSFFDSEVKLNLLYYKYDKINNKSEHYSTTIEDNLKQRVCNWFECYYDSSKYYNFQNKGLSCIYIKDYFYSDYYFVCFFVIKTTNYEYLEELAFIIDDTNNAIKKTTKYGHDYIEFNINTITNIKADRNDYENRALVCISATDNNSLCFKFYSNGDYTKFYKEITFKRKCSSEVYGIKVNYLYETNKVVFSCLLSDDTGGIQSAIFGKQLETPDYTRIFLKGCSNIYGYSIIYSHDDYEIISDMNCYISNITNESDSNIDEIISISDNIDDKQEEPKKENSIYIPTDNIDISTNEIIETTSKIKCPIQCKACTENNNDIICTECNDDKGYFPITYSDPPQLENCINEKIKEEKYPDYYFDTQTKYYKPCYEKCQTCTEKGDGENNNCLTCATGYILQPDYEYTKTCVSKYQYLYYYNEYNQYMTTETSNCPEIFPIKIKEKNKCIDKCSKDQTYNYTYNNLCYKQCPENTLVDNNDINLICKDNPSKCVLTKDEVYISNDTNINDKIKSFTEKYANEYNYTDNHISIINFGNYSITLYQNKSCINELSVSSTQLDLSNAFSKIKDHYNMEESAQLIVGLVKNKTGGETFEVYDPQSGTPLNIFNICKDDSYSMEKSLVAELSSNPRINFEDIKQMANQDINVIDLSDPFYTDLCFHYESSLNKDVPLRDRALIYYPNISLCEEGCELEAVYTQNWTAKCNCLFAQDKGGFKDNAFFQSQFGDYDELFSMANFNVMKCYKDIFELKYFVKSFGNFIVLTIIITDIICTFVYFRKSSFYIKKYIFSLTAKYAKYLQNLKSQISDINKGIIKSSPPPKNNGIDNANNDNNKINGQIIKVDKRKKGISSKNLEVFKKRKSKKSSINLIPKIHIKGNIEQISSNVHNDLDSSNKFGINSKPKIYLNQSDKYVNMIKSSNKVLNMNEADNNSNNLDIFIKDDIGIDIEDFLNTDLDDMDYDEAIRKDNRKFCKYYWEKIQSNQILINTFYVKEHLKPRPIKLVLLALQINLYFFINGIFFNEEYIKKKFDSKENTLYDAFQRFTDNLFYSFFVGVIVNYIIEFFFIQEKKLRIILKREKDNILVLKYEMTQIIKDINRRFVFFVIICLIIAIFSWYHLYCFNNIYPHTQKEWLIFSALIIACIQILSLLASFAETILRFLSFKFKSEKLFKLSQLLA